MLVNRPQPWSLTGPHVTPLAANRSTVAIDVVAHQVQLVRRRAVDRMHGHLGRRQLEDQPAASGVDVRVLEHVAEERAVRVGVAAVNNHMSAGDHRLTIRRDEFTARRWSARV